MAEHDEQDAEVEQRRTQPQQPVLVELAGARRPAELVVAVAPDVPAGEDRNRDVRDDDPQQRVHLRAPMYSGGANGSSPTSSAGGPDRASSSARSMSCTAGSGRTARIASSTSTYGECAS